MDILTLAIAKNKSSSADETITTESITNALGYKPADQEDVSQLSEDIADLKENVTGAGSGISSNLKSALKTYFTNMQSLLPQIAYVAESNYASTLISNAQAVVIALDASGDNGDSGGEDNPEITLSSISASYYGGDVKVGTTLSDLTGIVVTATYSDGSTASVTGYTLSGTIAEGSNTITVSYGGKTTTFTVTGVAELSGVSNEVVWTDGVPYTFEAIPETVSRTDGTFTASETYARSPYLYCKGASKIRIKVEVASSSITSIGMNNAFYDENKAFITNTSNTQANELGDVGTYKDYDVPANAVYFVACKQKAVVGYNVDKAYASYTPLA